MNKSSKLHDWTQVLTGCALIIGLLLVLLEIRQGQVIAYMQFTQAGYQEIFAFQRQRMGENPAATLIKACEQPEQLSQEEILVASAYFEYRYDSIELSKVLGEISGDEGIWQTIAETQLKDMFATKLGRVEFYRHKNNPHRWDPEIAAVAQAVLDSGDYMRCEDLYRSWKEGLAAPELD